MKLKRLVEDFQVEEQISLPTTGGAFAVYRLTKQSIGTLEAVGAIREEWRLDKPNINFAGLKDKHALTIQYVTVRDGPRRGLSQTNFNLEYVGQAPRPVHSSDIVGNRFMIVIRDLKADDVSPAIAAVTSIKQDGLPNYFDNQRFGSLGESGEFIAKPWCLGNYERALWLALAEPNVHDRPKNRHQKQFLRDHWGDWNGCSIALANSPVRPLIEYLAQNPTDFRRAITFLPHELRSLWLAAFQSHLWNRILAALIAQICNPEQCIPHILQGSSAPFFQGLSASQRDALNNTLLPLPSARLHLSDSLVKPLYDQVLASEGMELRQVRVKYPRDSFFSKGDRAALFQPGDFEHEFASDDVYPARQKLKMRFMLPRGSYATIVVKRLVGFAAEGMATVEWTTAE
jgi:tRNA pseudouridine13 synthase